MSIASIACGYGNCCAESPPTRWHAPARVHGAGLVGSSSPTGMDAGTIVRAAIVCADCFRHRVAAGKVASFTPPLSENVIAGLLERLRKFCGQGSPDWQWDMALRDWMPVSANIDGSTSSSSSSDFVSDSDSDWENGNADVALRKKKNPRKRHKADSRSAHDARPSKKHAHDLREDCALGRQNNSGDNDAEHCKSGTFRNSASDLDFFSDYDSDDACSNSKNPPKELLSSSSSSSSQSLFPSHSKPHALPEDDASAIPLHMALERLVPGLQSPDTLLSAATLLLDRVRDGLEDESGTKAILRAIALHAEPHPAVTEQVVQLVYFCDCPAAIVDVMAQISGTTEAEVKLIVDQFKELLKGDRELLVPILGSLADLTLPPSLRMETFHLSTAALSIVDEGDLPAVVRTLLRVTPIRTTERVHPMVVAVTKLRETTRGISGSTELLLVQVFHAAWIREPKVAQTFLTQLRAGSSNTALSSLDMSLLLVLLLSAPYRSDAQWCATVCLSSGSMGYDHLKSAIERSTTNEWAQLGPAVLELFQVYLRVVVEAGWGTDGSHVYVAWMRRLLAHLFAVNEAMRTPVCHMLIALFEYAVGTLAYSTNFSLGGASIAKAGAETDIVPVTKKKRGRPKKVDATVKAKAKAAAQSSINDVSGGSISMGASKKRAQLLLAREVAMLGTNVLLDLAESQPASLLSNFHLLEEAFLHMQPNLASTSAIVATHKIARSMALVARYESVRSNALLIATQKMIFSSLHGADSHTGAAGANEDTFADCRNYCIGVILGGHLVKSAGLSSEDSKTIICWVLRSMASVPRPALNFALDFFEHNMTKIQNELRASVKQNVIRPLVSQLNLGTKGAGNSVDGDEVRQCYKLHLNQTYKDGSMQGAGTMVNIARISRLQSSSWSLSKNVEMLGILSKLWSMRVAMELSKSSAARAVNSNGYLLGGILLMPEWPLVDTTGRSSSSSFDISDSDDNHISDSNQVEGVGWIERVFSSTWFRLANDAPVGFVSRTDASGALSRADAKVRRKQEKRERQDLISTLERVCWAAIDAHVLCAAIANGIYANLASLNANNRTSGGSSSGGSSSSSLNSSFNSSNRSDTNHHLYELMCFHTMVSLTMHRCATRVLQGEAIADGSSQRKQLASVVVSCPLVEFGPLVSLIETLHIKSRTTHTPLPLNTSISVSEHLHYLLEQSLPLDFNYTRRHRRGGESFVTVESLLTQHDRGAAQQIVTRLVEPGVLEWVFLEIKSATEWLESRWTGLAVSQMEDLTSDLNIRVRCLAYNLRCVQLVLAGLSQVARSTATKNLIIACFAGVLKPMNTTVRAAQASPSLSSKSVGLSYNAVFSFLLRLAKKTTERNILCLIIEVLSALTLNTRKRFAVGELCLESLKSVYHLSCNGVISVASGIPSALRALTRGEQCPRPYNATIMNPLWTLRIVHASGSKGSVIMERTEQQHLRFLIVTMSTLLSPVQLPKALYGISKSLGQLVRNHDNSSVEYDLRSVTLHSSSVVFHIMQRCVVSCLQLVDVGVGTIPEGQSPYCQYVQSYYLIGEMVRVRMAYSEGLDDSSSSSPPTSAPRLSARSRKHFMQFLTDVLTLMRHTVGKCLDWRSGVLPSAGGGLDANDSSLFSASHLKPLFEAGLRTTHIVKEFCRALASSTVLGTRRGKRTISAKKSSKVAKRMDNKSEAAFVPECLRLVEAFNVFVVESSESLSMTDWGVDMEADRREDSNPFILSSRKNSGNDAFRAVSNGPPESGESATAASNAENDSMDECERDWAEAPLHSVVRREVEVGIIRGGNSDMDGSSSSGSDSSSDEEGLGYVSDGSECSDDGDSDYEGSDSEDELVGKTLVIDFSKYRRGGRAV